MKRWLLLLLLGGMVTGCGGGYMISSWKAPDITGRTYNKILILALSVTADSTVIERMANHVAGDLIDLGYNAVPALNLRFNDTVVTIGSGDEAAALFQHNNVDAVITIVLLNNEKQLYNVPEWIYDTPHSPYGDAFWSYYLALKDRIGNLGYYGIETTYCLESNLFDVAGKKLVYTMHAENFNGTSTELLAHHFGKLLVKQMVKSGVLSK